VILLLAATLACAAPVCASAGRHPVRHRHRHYAARQEVRHLSVEMTDDGQFATTTWRPSPRLGQQASLPPNYRQRLGETGAVASLGYNKDAVGRTLDQHELDGAAEKRLGNSESTAGVSVKIPF
jgi:hypothetical protein